MILTDEQFKETCKQFADVCGCESFDLAKYDYEKNPYVTFTRQGEKWGIPVSSIFVFARAVKAAREDFENEFWKE